MIKRKTQIEKLAGILSCLLVSTSLDAQIVYTDIPDTLIAYPTIELLGDETTVYHLDLNNDGLIDFEFKLHKWQTWQTPSAQPISVVSQLVGQDNNKVLCIEEGDLPSCARVLVEDEPVLIGQTDYYSQADIRVNVISVSFSCNIPFQDSFYGVNFDIDGNTHFGWIHLDVSSSGEVTLKGFAYNSVENQGILAGQEFNASHIDQFVESNILVSQAVDKLHISQIDDIFLLEQVQLYDVKGVCFSEQKPNAFHSSIDIGGLSKGVYVLLIEAQGRQQSRLVYLD